MFTDLTKNDNLMAISVLAAPFLAACSQVDFAALLKPADETIMRLRTQLILMDNNLLIFAISER
jgi:hypothetical protein